MISYARHLYKAACSSGVVLKRSSDYVNHFSEVLQDWFISLMPFFLHTFSRHVIAEEKKNLSRKWGFKHFLSKEAEDSFLLLEMKVFADTLG